MYNEVSKGIPIGTVVMFRLGDKMPEQYLPCDGRSLLREEYPKLCERMKIGSLSIKFIYGSKNRNTFNIPSFSYCNGYLYIIKVGKRVKQYVSFVERFQFIDLD